MKRLLIALCLIWSSNVWAEEEIPQDLVLPSCQNEVILPQVNLLLENYNKEHPVDSLYEKRQRALQLKYAKEYKEETVAGYTSKKDENIANKLLMTKINQGLDDEQIRLCKSVQQNDRFPPIYLMMYFNNENHLEVHVLNFLKDQKEELKINLEI